LRLEKREEMRDFTFVFHKVNPREFRIIIHKKKIITKFITSVNGARTPPSAPILKEKKKRRVAKKKKEAYVPWPCNNDDTRTTYFTR
jgi:DNA primase large subunit